MAGSGKGQGFIGDFAQARTGLAHLPFSRNNLLAILVDEYHKPCSGLPCVITGILRKDFAPPDGSI